MSFNDLVFHQTHKNGQFYEMVKNPFQLQKRLKNDSKNSNFLKLSNDLKNVSRHLLGSLQHQNEAF